MPVATLDFLLRKTKTKTHHDALHPLKIPQNFNSNHHLWIAHRISQSVAVQSLELQFFVLKTDLKFELVERWYGKSNDHVVQLETKTPNNLAMTTSQIIIMDFGADF